MQAASDYICFSFLVPLSFGNPQSRVTHLSHGFPVLMHPLQASPLPYGFLSSPFSLPSTIFFSFSSRK